MPLFLRKRATAIGSLLSLLNVGDCLLGASTSDNNYKPVYVQEVKTVTDANGLFEKYVVAFTGEPLITTDDKVFVRINTSINQEIGTMVGTVLEGYTYNNPKPAGTTMSDKQKKKMSYARINEWFYRFV